MLYSLCRVLAMMAIVAGCGNHATPAQGPDTTVVANTSAPVTERTFGPQYVGNPDASVVLDYFYDYNCVKCWSQSLDVAELGNTNRDQILIRYHPYPLPGHKNALPAALAAEAARRQGSFVPMHNGLMKLRGDLTPERFRQLASELGLNLDQFYDDMADASSLAEVTNHQHLGDDLGIEAVPAVYINRTLQYPNDLNSLMKIVGPMLGDANRL